MNVSDADQAIRFLEHLSAEGDGVATSYARTFHMLVAWSQITRRGAGITQTTEYESFVVLPDVGAEIVVGAERTAAPARSIAILPAGTSTIVAAGTGTVIRLFAPIPQELARFAGNATAYSDVRDDLRPAGAAFRRIGPHAPRVYPLDPLTQANSGLPQSFQTETMSVGWFEQDGPQDQSNVHPHAHSDFEEGSLIVAGDFVQHLRRSWGSDLREWRDDGHRSCGPGSLMVIPPRTLHVAEARDSGKHILMNLFVPPREDHIAKGQIRNASEYAHIS
jgi:hypothetical protein